MTTSSGSKSVTKARALASWALMSSSNSAEGPGLGAVVAHPGGGATDTDRGHRPGKEAVVGGRGEDDHELGIEVGHEGASPRELGVDVLEQLRRGPRQVKQGAVRHAAQGDLGQGFHLPR